MRDKVCAFEPGLCFLEGKDKMKTTVASRGKKTAVIDVELPKTLRARVDRIAELTKRTPEQVVYDALAGFIAKKGARP